MIKIEKIEILTEDEVKTKSLEELQNLFIQLQEITFTENEIIEKLQKENEELRQNYDIATTEMEELKEQKEIDMYLIGDSINKEIVERDYIPKDKIREYIKEKEEEKKGVKNISLEEYAITSKELKESEICLLKCILEEK